MKWMTSKHHHRYYRSLTNPGGYAPFTSGEKSEGNSVFYEGTGGDVPPYGHSNRKHISKELKHSEEKTPNNIAVSPLVPHKSTNAKRESVHLGSNTR